MILVICVYVDCGMLDPYMFALMKRGVADVCV